jgi:hypothetical protein
VGGRSGFFCLHYVSVVENMFSCVDVNFVFFFSFFFTDDVLRFFVRIVYLVLFLSCAAFASW